MRRAVRLSFAASLALTAAACSTQAPPPPPPPPPPTVTVPPNAGVYKIGQPYQVDNVWYYPREQPDYDETGIASWYGPTFYGHHTANGEMYDGNQLTAAHKTLPMPVNVRVTNLENGKSLIVRVNDRGPYARGRIIDLSKRAAELLDVVETGTARVRVTYLGRADINGAPPPGNLAGHRQRLAGRAHCQGGHSRPGHPAGFHGGAAGQAHQMPTASIPAQLFADNQPTGQVTRVPVPVVTHLYIQLGAFSKLDNAKAFWPRWGETCGFRPFNAGARPSIECAVRRSPLLRTPMRRLPASPAPAPTTPISSWTSNSEISCFAVFSCFCPLWRPFCGLASASRRGPRSKPAPSMP